MYALIYVWTNGFVQSCKLFLVAKFTNFISLLKSKTKQSEILNYNIYSYL